MRTIKFRAWDGIRMTTSGIMFNTSTGRIEKPQVESFYIMQFTGLHDKDGKEIFEGDVVRGLNYDCTEKFISVIEFYKGEFRTIVKKYDVQYSVCTWNIPLYVIGNIHENPELLA